MLTLGTEQDMDAQANEQMLGGIVRRLERDGHYLTPAAVDRIHKIITDCVPDTRTEGNQRQLGDFVKDRMDRDEQR